MFRVLSYGPATVGLAALVAFVAMLGFAARPAEAVPTAVAVNITAATLSCNGSSPVTATVTDNMTTYSGAVTFVASAGGTIANATAVNGVATSTLYVTSAYSGTVTVTATAGSVSGSDSVTVQCGTGINNPCGLYNFGCGYNACFQNSLYVYATCDFTSNCVGGGCQGAYGGCGGYGGFNYGIYGCGGYNQCTPGYGSTGFYGTNLPPFGCNFAPCANQYGPILACTNAYAPPAGSLAALPSRVSILPGATSVSCGGATSITATVTDPHGFYAPDGTIVNFTTTLGYISSTDSAIGGTAVTSLTIPPGTVGTARVTASAGGHAADTTINVTCSAGAPAVAAIPAQPSAATLPLAGLPAQIAQAIPVQAIAQALTGRGAILPPSTGDAGLLELISE
jgi:hypothetical protein